MICRSLIPSAKTFRLPFLCTLLLTAAKFQAVAQTTINTASFNADGTVNAGNTYTLDTFLVTSTYYGASPSTAYISDNSGVSGRIYGASTVASLTIGSEYTATVTTSSFSGSEEFTATSVTPAGMLTAITVPTVSPTQVSTSAAMPLSPSAGTYNSLLYSGVSFTLTPQAGGTLSTTGTLTVTDSTTGAVVSLYRSEAATALTAGQKYTITGAVQSFNGDAEIVSANAVAVAAAPEPGSWVACALGGTVLAGMAARRRLTAV